LRKKKTETLTNLQRGIWSATTQSWISIDEQNRRLVSFWINELRNKDTIVNYCSSSDDEESVWEDYDSESFIDSTNESDFSTASDIHEIIDLEESPSVLKLNIYPSILDEYILKCHEENTDEFWDLVLEILKGDVKSLVQVGIDLQLILAIKQRDFDFLRVVKCFIIFGEKLNKEIEEEEIIYKIKESLVLQEDHVELTTIDPKSYLGYKDSDLKEDQVKDWPRSDITNNLFQTQRNSSSEMIIESEAIDLSNLSYELKTRMNAKRLYERHLIRKVTTRWRDNDLIVMKYLDDVDIGLKDYLFSLRKFTDSIVEFEITFKDSDLLYSGLSDERLFQQYLLFYVKRINENR
jgi:hypothetical protein